MKLSTYFLATVAILGTSALAVNAQVPGVNSTLQSVFTLAYDNSTMKPTYSATYAGSPTASGGTDICAINGSASKTVKVRRVSFNGDASTAVTEPIAFIKRSAVDTGGTVVRLVVAPYDSQNPTSTVVAEAFTANPTLGAQAGVLADPFVSFGNLTTGGAQALPSAYKFGELGQPVVLRGIAQQLAINLNGISYSGLIASCTFEWTEE